MLNNTDHKKMWQEFKSMGQSGLYMNHYDLARESQTYNDPHHWKLFLMDPEVGEYISSEMELLQKSELKKILKNIGESNSVGKAQLINVLNKLSEDNTNKEGPTFIYTYIPLSSEQEQHSNVHKLEQDPFTK